MMKLQIKNKLMFPIFTNQFMKVAILCFGFASALADAGYGYGGYGRSYGGMVVIAEVMDMAMEREMLKLML